MYSMAKPVNSTNLPAGHYNTAKLSSLPEKYAAPANFSFAIPG
jgi:hypothetical protein